MKLLSELKYLYLDQFKQGDKGGTSHGFRNFALGELDKDPERFMEEIEYLMSKAATQAWGEKLAGGSKANHKQQTLDLAGTALPAEITYADIDGLGKRQYYKKLVAHASIAEFEGHYYEVQSNANKQVAAADVVLAQLNEMKQRSGGDMNARILDLVDEKPEEKSE